MTDVPISALPTARRRGGRFRKAGIALLALLLVLSPWEWSLFRAMTAPGTDSEQARVAEWVRGHSGGPLVTWAENLQYKLHPPKVGGSIAGNSPLHSSLPASGTSAAPAPSATSADTRTPSRQPTSPQPASPQPTSTDRPATPTPTSSAAPAPTTPALLAPSLPPVVAAARPALPGEGVWHTLAKVRGVPALRAAFVRPDAVHTSYTAGIVRMDQRLLSTVYHTGTDQPGGGPWTQPPNLAGPRRVGLLAAYNSAFRLGDAQGGFYNQGKTVAPLRPGAAAMVTYADGRVDVGAWGTDVAMSASVVSVRENLRLVIDKGAVVPDINDNSGERWGQTLSQKAYVWRTGVGVAANGDVVFAAGNSLSAPTLAQLLLDGGAVRAMELDINPAWTSFNLYGIAAGSPGGERKLLPDMQPSVTRYDSYSSRDFYAVYAR